MKHLLALILLHILTYSVNGQVEVIKDYLDHPIDMTFIDDQVFVVEHGQNPGKGRIISFDVTNPNGGFEILFEDLAYYPRAIANRDSILYIGLTQSIKFIDLRKEPKEFKTLPINGNIHFPRSLLFIENELFIAEDKGVYKIDITNPDLTKELIVEFLDNAPLSLQHENEYLYIASGKTIFRFNLITNSLEEVIVGLEHRVYSILIHNNQLYLDQSNLSFEQEDILVFNLDNLNSGATLFCNELISAIGMRYHKGSIYLASQKPNFQGEKEGKILRLDKGRLLSTGEEKEYSINLYPNPINQVLKIETSDRETNTLQIRTLSGKLIKECASTSTVDVADLEPGGYLFVITDEYQHVLFKEILVKN